MIFLLNYLPWLIGLLTTYLVIRTQRKNKRLAFWILVSGCVATWLLLTLAATSYIPKGTVAPLGNPAFDSTTAEVQDRLRKPGRNSKEAAEFLKEQSDWRKINAERQKEKQQ